MRRTVTKKRLNMYDGNIRKNAPFFFAKCGILSLVSGKESVFNDYTDLRYIPAKNLKFPH
jgi:hypothetical protein